MNQVYVIWELVPESTQIYLLILSNEELERAKRCHGHFINLADTPPDIEEDLLWLNKYLENQLSSLVYDGKSENSATISVQEDALLIVSGFIL